MRLFVKFHDQKVLLKRCFWIKALFKQNKKRGFRKSRCSFKRDYKINKNSQDTELVKLSHIDMIQYSLLIQK